MKRFLEVVDLPYHIANHIVGDQHTILHRKVVGVIVMIAGVTLAHVSAHFSNVVVSLAGDLIGYSIHGTGLLPFVHSIENTNTNQQNHHQ